MLLMLYERSMFSNVNHENVEWLTKIMLMTNIHMYTILYCNMLDINFLRSLMKSDGKLAYVYCEKIVGL